MFAFYIILAVYLFLIGWGSYAIAGTVRRKLVSSGNRYARVWHIATMVVSFIVIFCTLSYLIVSNMSFER